MMIPEEMERLYQALLATGLPKKRASDYAVAINDKPEYDDEGKIIIRDSSGDIIDRINPPPGWERTTVDV